MMTVAELIALLQTMPQDIPVTGYASDESTCFVSKASIQVRHTADTSGDIIFDEHGSIYNGRYLDIMGF